MTKIGVPLVLFGAAVVVALPAARAQPMKVFVAAQGSDSNPCTIAAPCLTFQYAHDTVAARGVIEVLNPADYGILTITKSISIEGHGFAGIGVGAGNRGIRVAASATDAVYLNGLIIEGYGQGQKGIEFLNGQSLAVENCVIREMSNGGLDFLYSSPKSLQALFVSNSNFAENGDHGIVIFPWPRNATTAGLTASIGRVALYRNGVGVSVKATARQGRSALRPRTALPPTTVPVPRAFTLHHTAAPSRPLRSHVRWPSATVWVYTL